MWTYATDDLPNYSYLGSGCSAGNLVTLENANGSLPWTGDPFTVALNGEPPGSLAWMATGFSSTQWGSTALPFDLGSVGAPGCWLRIEPFVWYPMTRNAQGRAEWTITIPTSTALIGASFYNQALVLHPSANPLGAILSAAMHGVIGAR